MARCAAGITALLLVLLLVAFAEGRREQALGAGSVADPATSTAASTSVPTASVVDCLMGCVTQASDCATYCTEKPLGEAVNCSLACVEADLTCVRECGPALGPPPPANV